MLNWEGSTTSSPKPAGPRFAFFLFIPYKFFNALEFNQVLAKPVMIMGADVSHPAPESRKFKPSIVAVTGSVEPKATQYETQVHQLDHFFITLSIVF